jgi:hypothetical protein
VREDEIFVYLGDSGTNFHPAKTLIRGRTVAREMTFQSPESQPIMGKKQSPKVLEVQIQTFNFYS